MFEDMLDPRSIWSTGSRPPHDAGKLDPRANARSQSWRGRCVGLEMGLGEHVQPILPLRFFA